MEGSFDDFFCFFCGSEMTTDEKVTAAKCENPWCSAVFKFSKVNGCVRRISVNSCGEECSCVKKL